MIILLKKRCSIKLRTQDSNCDTYLIYNFVKNQERYLMIYKTNCYFIPMSNLLDLLFRN